MKLIKLWEADIDKAFDLQNSFQSDENGFVNLACGLSLEEFERYVQIAKDNFSGINLKDGYVPGTIYILEADGKYVGIFNFRHYLNDFLNNGPGHIGFGISKKYRGKGYASTGLKLLIEEVKESIEEDEFQMSVHKDNPASLQVQIKNNAYIHHEDDKEYFTRIKK